MRILIINQNLVMGGRETSLLNFIRNMHKYADIDLLLLNREGILLEKVPKYVNIIEAPAILKGYGSVNTGKVNKFKDKIKNILKKMGAVSLKAHLVLKNLNKANIDLKLTHKYDIAISFYGFNYVSNELVLKYVQADVKFCIIHGDVYKLDLANVLKRQFKEFDYCLGCSKSTSETFMKKYKTLHNVDTLYNFQDIDKVTNGALEQTESIKNKDRLCLGTIGRLQVQKAPLRFMKVIKKLNKKGFEFDFYWVGDGEDRPKAEKYIKKHNLYNVHLLGNQLNPFKYSKQFDVFVLASKHEAAPMVYAEAMTLGIPVLTTDTCSAYELVGEKGWVCKNSEKGIYDSLTHILNNPNEIQEKKEKLKNYKWDNEQIVEKVLSLVKSNN